VISMNNATNRHTVAERKVPMTSRTFKSAAARTFRTANPGAGATVVWTHGPVAVTWHDGTDGFSGTFTATADGYRTRTMHAYSLDGIVKVR